MKLKETLLPPLEPPLNRMSLIISVKFLLFSDTNILAGLVGMMGLVIFREIRILATYVLITLIHSFHP